MLYAHLGVSVTTRDRPVTEAEPGRDRSCLRVRPAEPVARNRASLAVLRLIELNLEAARNLEERDQTVAVVLDLLGEFDPSGLKLPNGLTDIVP